MLYGGIADRHRRVREEPGRAHPRRLGMSNVVACTLFGGVSARRSPTSSAMGAVMIPMMKREGYAADYAVNVHHARGARRCVMPTSHNMIIYSLAGGRQGVDRRR
jgi:TRAP-type C4-dicarboxylate transport system permease large subunit